MALQRLSSLLRWMRVGCILCITAVLLSATASRTYESKRFHYLLDVPNGWRVSVSPSGVVVLANYGPKKALPQGLMQDGCANIYIVPFSAVRAVMPALDMNAWIKSNNDQWHSNVVMQPIPSWSNAEGVPQQIMQVAADYERDSQDDELQAEINYYFLLRGSPFRLSALYWKNDKRAAYFAARTREILRSIRAQ